MRPKATVEANSITDETETFPGVRYFVRYIDNEIGILLDYSTNDMKSWEGVVAKVTTTAGYTLREAYFIKNGERM